jgi:ABC-2 type transport system permease protein
LLFSAGLWLSREHMAPILRDISDWTPLGAAVRSLQNSMQGAFPSVQSLLVLVGWAAVFGKEDVRFFRWE